MGPFSQVPGLAGYQQQVALNDQQGNQQMMRLSQLMQMAQAQQGMQKSGIEMSEMQDRLARQKRIRDALTTGQELQAQQQPYGGGYSPSVSQAFGVPAGQPAQAPAASGGASRAIAEKFNKMADIYEQNGEPEQAMKIREHAQKLMPEIKEVRTSTLGGKPVEVIYYKDGTTSVSPFGAKPNIHMQSLGNKVVAIDQNATQGGQEWAMGQSPDSVASVNISMRGQNMADARAREANSIAQGRGAREDSDGIRKEWNSLPEVKNFKDVVPIINAAFTAPDTAAGDFALIYGVGKVLDPGSVVREGEMGMVMKSGSPAERVKGYLSYLQGKGRLTPQLRAELTSMLGGRVSEMKSSYDASKMTYEALARKRGYDPKDIFADVPEVKTRQAKASPTGPVANKNITVDW